MPAAALQGKPGPLATRLADLLAILGASPVRSQCQTEAQPRGSCSPDGAYHHRHSGQALRATAGRHAAHHDAEAGRSEEHTSELQSLMRNSSDVFCLNKKTIKRQTIDTLHRT